MPSSQMESIRNAMRMMMKQQGMTMFGNKIDPFLLRANIEAAEKRMQNEPGVSFLPEELGGVEAEICIPDSARTDGVIIYIHGGGLVCGNALSSRGYGSMLAGETGLLREQKQLLKPTMQLNFSLHSKTHPVNLRKI